MTTSRADTARSSAVRVAPAALMLTTPLLPSVENPPPLTVQAPPTSALPLVAAVRPKPSLAIAVAYGGAVTVTCCVVLALVPRSSVTVSVTV